MDFPPCTLGYHRQMSVTLFGEQSKATQYLDKKIAESPRGSLEVVIAPESQMIALLFDLHRSGLK